MSKIIVFDLETKKAFEEVGGQRNAAILGVSVCGVWDNVSNLFKAYREEQLAELEQEMSQADLLVGFNSKRFDNVVLQPYFKNLKLDTLPHVDILEIVHGHLGFRLKLETIAQCTLGEGKSGTGLDAIRYFREGDWNNLEKYCLDDVRITRDLYWYGQRHGLVWYKEGGELKAIPVNWQTTGEPPLLVKDIVNEAWAKGQQLVIEYILVSNKGTERKKMEVDVLAVDSDQVRVFDHSGKGEQRIFIPRIFDAHVIGDAKSFQQKLF